ncbi:hypothetical protein FMM05_07930 [Flavobacterium zepuense]|uniref:Uncharacterized protein n=1 Tax=Flavobacterium zepuense TaxID=2593302 RepID=A0A552V416_9FLAO|nr:hypothetical protein [Flavobacterium zepuense]TRW25225.1 hypothetical protein FMM05_07930 [Flavobacterium zepuense]
MKRIRKITDNNKGFVTFCFVIFFFMAGFAKSFAAKMPTHFKKEVALKDTSKQTLTQFVAEESDFSILDQLKDTDTNDIEFAFFGTHSASKVIVPETTERKFREFVQYKNADTSALYDLYCNWKIHLS